MLLRNEQHPHLHSSRKLKWIAYLFKNICSQRNTVNQFLDQLYSCSESKFIDEARDDFFETSQKELSEFKDSLDAAVLSDEQTLLELSPIEKLLIRASKHEVPLSTVEMQLGFKHFEETDWSPKGIWFMFLAFKIIQFQTSSKHYQLSLLKKIFQGLSFVNVYFSLINNSELLEFLGKKLTKMLTPQAFALHLECITSSFEIKLLQNLKDGSPAEDLIGHSYLLQEMMNEIYDFDRWMTYLCLNVKSNKQSEMALIRTDEIRFRCMEKTESEVQNFHKYTHKLEAILRMNQVEFQYAFVNPYEFVLLSGIKNQLPWQIIKAQLIQTQSKQPTFSVTKFIDESLLATCTSQVIMTQLSLKYPLGLSFSNYRNQLSSEDYGHTYSNQFKFSELKEICRIGQFSKPQLLWIIYLLYQIRSSHGNKNRQFYEHCPLLVKLQICQIKKLLRVIYQTEIEYIFQNILTKILALNQDYADLSPFQLEREVILTLKEEKPWSFLRNQIKLVKYWIDDFQTIEIWSEHYSWIFFLCHYILCLTQTSYSCKLKLSLHFRISMVAVEKQLIRNSHHQLKFHQRMKKMICIKNTYPKLSKLTCIFEEILLNGIHAHQLWADIEWKLNFKQLPAEYEETVWLSYLCLNVKDNQCGELVGLGKNYDRKIIQKFTRKALKHQNKFRERLNKLLQLNIEYCISYEVELILVKAILNDIPWKIVKREAVSALACEINLNDSKRSLQQLANRMEQQLKGLCFLEIDANMKLEGVFFDDSKLLKQQSSINNQPQSMNRAETSFSSQQISDSKTSQFLLSLQFQEQANFHSQQMSELNLSQQSDFTISNQNHLDSFEFQDSSKNKEFKTFFQIYKREESVECLKLEVQNIPT